MRRRRERSSSLSSSSSDFSGESSDEGRNRGMERENNVGNEKGEGTESEEWKGRSTYRGGSAGYERMDHSNGRKMMYDSPPRRRGDSTSRSRSRGYGRRSPSPRHRYSRNNRNSRMDFDEFLAKLSDDVSKTEAEIKYREYTAAFDRALSPVLYSRRTGIYHVSGAKEISRLEGNIGGSRIGFSTGSIPEDVSKLCWDHLNELFVLKKYVPLKKEKVGDTEPLENVTDDDSNTLAVDGRQYERQTCTLFLRALPSRATRGALVALLESLRCYSDVVSISFSSISPNDTRHVWITYDTEDSAVVAKNMIEGKELEGYKLFPIFNLHRFENKPLVFTCSRERFTDDLRRLKKISSLLDKKQEIEGGFENLVDSTDENTIMKEVDRMLFYLRYVHCFCYYCCVRETDSNSLVKKCPSFHTHRCSDEILYDPNEDEHTKKIDSFVTELEQDKKEKRLGDEIREKKKEEAIETLISEGKRGLFKCEAINCTKLFKGRDFLRKHILHKHEEILESRMERIEEDIFKKNFLEDNEKPIPFQSPRPDSYSRRSSFKRKYSSYEVYSRDDERYYGEPSTSKKYRRDSRHAVGYRDLDEPVADVPDYRSDISSLLK